MQRVLWIGQLLAALLAPAALAATNKHCPALSVKIAMPATMKVGEAVNMRIKLRNQCKTPSPLPNVTLEIELPHSVEVVSEGKGGKGGGWATKKNHTRLLVGHEQQGRELQGRRRVDGSGPYTLQGRKPVVRSLKVRIRPCTEAASATKLHFVAQAFTPNIPRLVPRAGISPGTRT